MKKVFLFIFLGISVLFFSAYVGIQLISKNIPKEDQYKNKDIVKVNVPEKVEDENEASIETNTPIINEVSAKVFSLDYPIEGEIGLTYSPDTLIYSKTLQEWIVHNGIDIQAKRGTPVKSSEEGKVESITETADMGIMIIIDHENGYKTIYSNLSSKDMVKVGDRVEKGQVISGVGNTSGFEYYEADHLHFEIKKDGKFVNPIEILKEH